MAVSPKYYGSNDELLGILTEIASRRGELTPDVVVEDSTPVDAPLHDRFEWNDTVAGPLYRREQAHALIRSVTVVYRDAVGDEKKVRALIPVPRPATPQPTYEPVVDVIADPFKRQLMLRQAEREWKALKRRYEHLSEFTALVKADLGLGNGDSVPA